MTTKIPENKNFERLNEMVAQVVQQEYQEPRELHDGSIMEGEFDHGTGRGTRTFKDGRIWEGEFVDWVLEGSGTKTFPGTMIMKGLFRGARLNGHGKITHLDGISSEGLFENDQLVSGTMIWPNVAKFEGHFVNGKLQGPNCKITYQDGKIEEGSFVEGQLQGPGKVTHPNGQVDEGLFDQGILTFRKV